MTKARKALGGFGERCLDERLAQLGWSIIAANCRFRGGEIDRVYASGAALRRHYCVAEIKTLRVFGARHLATLIGGDFLRSALRPRQCRNLALWGRILSLQGKLRVSIRVFRLFVFQEPEACNEAEKNLRGQYCFNVQGRAPVASRVKVLRVTPLSFALCIDPEFVPRGQATSPYQVELV
jgi:hypothetical protein